MAKRVYTREARKFQPFMSSVAASAEVVHAISADSVPWTGVTDKPSTFAPSAHQHEGDDITTPVDEAVNSDTLDGIHASEFPLLAAANEFSSTQTLRPAEDVSVLEIHTNPDQNANLINVYDSSEVLRCFMDANGWLMNYLILRRSPVGDILQIQNEAASALMGIKHSGAIYLAALADVDAENGTLYYSTTGNKLAYKNSSGVVTYLSTDADTLDGQHASAFAAASHTHVAADVTNLTSISETRLAIISVDLNSATATTLYTVPSGKTCNVTKIVFKSASTSLTTASWSVGWNSTAYDNVIADATHTELTGNTLYTVLPVKAGATRGSATNVLKCKANTLQGSAATVIADVFGYLF